LPLSEDGERVSKILCHDVGIMPAALDQEAQSDDVAEG
jgi:hypothetical protein